MGMIDGTERATDVPLDASQGASLCRRRIARERTSLIDPEHAQILRVGAYFARRQGSLSRN